METIKHMLGTLAMILCLVLVAAAVWYCLFGFSDGHPYNKGTLVSRPLQQEEVCV